MEIYQIIILIVVVVGIVGGLLYWQKKEKAREPGGSDVHARALAIKDRRRQQAGWHLWVESGVQPTPEKTAAIEAGIRYCIAKARVQPGYEQHPNWAKATDITRYNVAMFGDVMKSPEGGVWCYKIPCPSDYLLTKWNVDGSLLVAGQTLEEDGPNEILIVVPDHPDGFGSCQCTSNECEHVILYNVDRPKYEETKFHTVGGHPLIEDLPQAQAVGFKSATKPPEFFCGGAGH